MNMPIPPRLVRLGSSPVRRISLAVITSIAALSLFDAAQTSHAQALPPGAVATYEFQNNFNAMESGAPALTPVNPTGTSVFTTDMVLGQMRPVWQFNGDASNANQSGLSLNTSGLIPPQSYSVDMVFEFTQRANSWRRIIDVENRQSDSGFYVDPSNNLDIFPVSGSSAAWTNNVFHHVVLTNNGAMVAVYLDGISQFTSSTTLLNLDNPNNPGRLMNFFLDNVAAGGQGEWSAGEVALIRMWNRPLTPAEAQQIANNPFAIPEPSTYALIGLGAGLLRFVTLRRKREKLSDRF